MSETLTAHLTTIATKAKSLAERVDVVEVWLRSLQSTPAPTSRTDSPPLTLSTESVIPCPYRSPHQRYVQNLALVRGRQQGWPDRQPDGLPPLPHLLGNQVSTERYIYSHCPNRDQTDMPSSQLIKCLCRTLHSRVSCLSSPKTRIVH